MLTPDDGYYFGLGAFETIAVEQGVPILLKDHLTRLQKTADFLGITVEEEHILKKIQETLAQKEMQTGSKVLKVALSDKNLTITTKENSYTEKQYQKGFVTAFSTVRRNESSPLTYHKTFNYGDCILEKRLAKQQGIDEPIFLNTKGMITEGAVTNVFFVKNKKLYTPKKSCGLLPGILRKYILEHYDVKEEEIAPSYIHLFEEMFVTNSLLGIMPVVSLGEHKFMSREITDIIRSEYLSYCLSCTLT